MASMIHFKYWKNILISRLYEQFSRNDSSKVPEKIIKLLTLLPTAFYDFLSFGGGGGGEGEGDYYPTPQKTMLGLSDRFEIWHR